MNNKLTWFIPGLLVTLLLGLLWAMPASAAVAGTIQFLDKKGGDAITHVSLNGAAADGGFFVQITDADLDPVVDVKIKGADTGTAPAVIFATIDNVADAIEVGEGFLSEESGYTLHDVQDSTGDGVVDNRDFTAWNYESPSAVDGDVGDVEQVEDASFGYDRSNGTLTFAAADGTDTHEIRFKVKKTTIIGARNGSDQMATLNLDAGTDGADEGIDDDALNTMFNAGEDTADDPSDDFKPDESRIVGDDGDLAWVELLSSKVSDLTTRMIYIEAEDNTSRTTEAEMEAELAALINAYNAGKPTDKLEVSVAVDFDTDPAADTPSTVTGAGVTISNTDPTAEVDEETICVGLNQLATPTLPTGTTAVADADYNCDITPATTGVVVYEAANLVVEVDYIGSVNTVYEGVGRIGDLKEVNRVTIDSDAANPISVRLEETSSASGVFGAMVMICDPSDEAGTDKCANGKTATQGGEDEDGAAGTVTLPVNAAGDTIRISYRDASPGGTRTRSISLDATAPSFNNPSPASGSAGKATEPELSVEVVDAASGIVDDEDEDKTIQFVGKLVDTTGATIAGPKTIMRSDLDDDDSITDGFAVTAAFQEGDGDDELDNDGSNEYMIHWWVVAMDQAGNQGVTDQKPSSTLTGTVDVKMDENTVTGTKTKFNDELNVGAYITIEGQVRKISAIASDTSLTVEGMDFTADADNASFTSGACHSQTFNLHSDGGTEMAGCDPFVVRVDTKRPVMSKAIAGGYLDDDNMPKQGRRTSVRVEFDEALDCDSVSASDFEVNDVAPGAASCHGKYVALTVDEMDSNATPKVELVGAVTDMAGNELTSGAIAAAEDGISSNLTVTLAGTGEGDRPVTRNRITVTITSDEKLSGNPTVTIHKVGGDYMLTGEREGSASPTGATNAWEYSTSYTSAGDDGLYNVRVTATDRGASSATASAGLMGVRVDADDANMGYKLDKDMVKDSKAILFEVDSEVRDPSWMPSDGSTDNPDVFIRASFSNEGKEYGLGATGDDDETAEATDDPADVVTDFDTHGTVMLVSATFNGDDVTDAVTTQDNVTFFYNPRNLSIDEHQMKIKVKDNAGNEKEFPYDLAVTARQAFKLNLQPGANLVSLPSTPDNGDVNAVFGGENAITSVVTRDNGTGLWMTALRGADGMFAGDLTTIDAQHGYWVVSDAPVELSIALPRSGGLTFVPPAIEVRQGWNLVAVTDLQQRKAGTKIDSKDYFANIDWDVAYGYNPLDGVFERKVDTADADADGNEVEVGKGYWVYANKAGIIIP